MAQDAREGVSGPGISLPSRIVVSLRVGFVLALANVLCAAILGMAWVSSHAEPKTLSVTGSAKKELRSDLIVWDATISVNKPDLASAYDQLKTSSDKTLAFLKAGGVPDSQVQLLSIKVQKNFVRDGKGNLTDQISSFDLSQSVEVTSNDVDRVADLSRSATGLIKDGVLLESESPSYLYTKLADLKIEMLAEATRDATERARQIAENSGARLGALVDAKMGVMQINAIHSNDVSDSGNNDTSSLEKEITAVVSARFQLK
jgi:uncharacterized protein